MGRTNNTTPDIGNSMTIINGKWTVRVPEGTEGATARELTKGTNAGSIVYELGWRTLEDYHIMGGKLVKSEHFSGLNAEISLKDFRTGEQVIVSLPADSKYLKSFIGCLPLIKTELPVNLELSVGRKKTATGGDTYNFKIFQENKSLKNFYVEWKKDATGKNIAIMQHGCPAAEESRKGLNFDKQDEFLWSKFEEFFNGYVPPNMSSASSYAPPVSKRSDPVESEEEDDDSDPIPF